MKDLSLLPKRRLTEEEQKEFERRAHAVDGKECPTKDYSKINTEHQDN